LAWWNPKDGDFLAWRAGKTVVGVGKKVLYDLPKDAKQGVWDWKYESISGVYLVDMDHLDSQGRPIPIPILSGDFDYDDLRSVLSDPRIADVSDVWLNGQSNNLKRSARLLIEHLGLRKQGKGKGILIHNPTNGVVADTFQSTMGKLVGSSRVARQTAAILSYRAERNIPTHLVVHSQGGIMGTNALKELHKTFGTTNWSAAAIEHHGSASPYLKARYRAAKTGMEWWGMHNDPRDAVGVAIGLNTINPAKLAISLLYAPTLAMSSNTDRVEQNMAARRIWGASNHTYYDPIPEKEHWSRIFTFYLW